MRNTVLFIIVYYIFLLSSVTGQTIESVVSRSFQPFVIPSSAASLQAANIIVSEFNKYGALRCSNILTSTLEKRISEVRITHIPVVKKGAVAEFLVLVNKFSCEVIGMVHKTQVVRVKNNKCSINDIKLESPDLIYDPTKTGFFSVKLQF
ncbi:hypothetical protein EXU57_24400 [Segetibacter sp. 3557_3]|uniref:hypothetical protein n=1 Tax=Segetibacter sp. 3557_3 TaxID=2547429 RepID=UPI001058F709|nr:hypothetical protein [Segetibacter sp. 3557_3]TDH18065.1 hypothetical protein EXU57_24400 [Segetibacter sp. 3557_3]